MTFDKRKLKPEKAWAWAIETEKGWQLCQWADPERLTNRCYKPSPEAKRVYVEMKPYSRKRK